MEAVEFRLRGEEATFLQLRENIASQDQVKDTLVVSPLTEAQIQLELTDCARLVCNQVTDEVAEKLVSLARRIAALRRKATCMKDLQLLNAVDTEVGAVHASRP